MNRAFLTFFLFLLCSSSLFAQDDSGGANWGVVDIADFSGGLNTRDGAGGIADNELQSSNNTYLLAQGIAKRSGFERYNSSARISATNQGTGIVNAPFTAGDQIVGVAGAVISKKGTGSWTSITGNATITADKPFLFTMINNVLVAANGTDSLLYYTGTGNVVALASTNMPTAPTALAEFHGKLFLAQGRRLYWSNYLGKWKEFHPDDWQDFEENITGLHVIGEANDAALIVTTKRSIHSVYFDPAIAINIGGRGSFRFDTLSKKHGCISPYSIQECLTENGDILLVWADRDGLKALLGDKIIKLTDKMQPDWDLLNISVLTESVGIHYKSKRWYMLVCTTASGTPHNQVIIFDLRHWSVSGLFDWPISAINIIPNSSDVDELVGSDYDGYWNTYDSSTDDNGTAILASFETKSFDGEKPLFQKAFNAIGFQHSYLGEYGMDFTLYYDYSVDSYTTSYTANSAAVALGVFVLDVDRLSGTGALVIKAQEVFGQGRNAHLKVSNTAVGETFKLYRLQLIYQLGRMVIFR